MSLIQLEKFSEIKMWLYKVVVKEWDFSFLVLVSANEKGALTNPTSNMTAPLGKGTHYVEYSESLTLWSIVILPYCSFYDAMLISQSFFKQAS